MTIEYAPAKINLALHVTGQRPDGYHELNSIVAFADYGDVLTVEPGGSDNLRVVGRFAPELDAGAGNLVSKARALLERPREPGCGWTQALTLTLEKNLPVASGIGGGSADAAASLRALNKVRELNLGVADLEQMSRELGADVAMCIGSRAAFVSGTGDAIVPLASFPTLPAVLINPLVEVSTPAVFKGLAVKTNAPMPPLPGAGFSLAALVEFLRQCRNDLEAPARRIAPAINDVLTALRANPECLVARMSGSGATCFALFGSDDQAVAASQNLADGHPEWWVRACRITDDPFGFANSHSGQ